MRADRLVAVLLLLQQRGHVTAAQVAAELEVSERTARRDLDALGMAGLPVYALRGRNGGWRLAGGGRTDLSGLTADETRALFLVAAASTAGTAELRGALRKLVRALPPELRKGAEAASSAVVVDPSGWDRPAPARPVPHLDAVQRAVVDGHEVQLGYVDRTAAPTTRTVGPLGLAAKGSNWYLLADTASGLRTFRVDRITAVDPTGRAVLRPDGFDLADAWRLIVDEIDRRRTPAVARCAIRPDMVGVVRAVLGNRVGIGPPRPDGRVDAEVRGHSDRSLAGELAGFGAAVEVLDRPELRHALAAVGAELVALYGAVVAPAPP